MSRALSQAVAALFERFWAAYPARPRNPKAAARAVFLRRVQAGANPDAMVRAATRFAAEIKRDKVDPLFVPHARTWLSQRRDEDYPDPPETSGETPAGELAPAVDPVWRALQGEMSHEAYVSWIKPCFVTVDCTEAQAIVRVSAPSKFVAHYVETHFQPALKRGFGASSVFVTVNGKWL